MAVFTPVTDAECEAFLNAYDLGTFKTCAGITQGVENTNFLVRTERGKYILTLFEARVPYEDLPFFVHLMEGLAEAGVPCPLPVMARDGQALRWLNGKPALMVSFLEGREAERITPDHCRQLGALLARMHQADTGLSRPNSMGLGCWERMVEKVQPHADTVEEGLAVKLVGEMNYLRARWPKGLTQGVIHADVFPDNVFFDAAGTLSGIIDFYFACTDALLYELAIAVNAWGFEKKHGRWVYDINRVQALCGAYQEVMQLPQTEWDAFPILCRGAAMRFLLTRAHDWLLETGEAMIVPKDPKEYLAKLQFHQQKRQWREYGVMW